MTALPIRIRTLLFALSSLASLIHGYPAAAIVATEAEAIDYGSAEFLEKVFIIIFLVLLGGVFAGKFFMTKVVSQYIEIGVMGYY